MKKPESFESAVARVVKAIPRGRVISYAQVALRAGKPGAARAVAKVMSASTGLPWWRVARSDKTLAKAVADDQARRLRAEGVVVQGRRIRSLPGRIDAPGGISMARPPASSRMAAKRPVAH